MRSIPALIVLTFGVPLSAQDADLTTPTAALRSYLRAVKANDVDMAKRCWTIDDDNASGGLDVICGMAIAGRRLTATTHQRFGVEGVRRLGKWNNPAWSDAALERTLERLGSASVRERGRAAFITIAWQPGDGRDQPVFFDIQAPALPCRRIGDEWRLDANVFTGVESAANLLEPDSIWTIWRDRMNLMNEFTSALERGTIATVDDLDRQIRARVAESAARRIR